MRNIVMQVLKYWISNGVRNDVSIALFQLFVKVVFGEYIFLCRYHHSPKMKKYEFVYLKNILLLQMNILWYNRHITVYRYAEVMI